MRRLWRDPCWHISYGTHMTAPIFILAGEASGDVLASRIMQAINTHYGQQNWVGLGGDHMTAEGLRSIGDMHRLSLIGLGEAIKNYNVCQYYNCSDILVPLLASSPDPVESPVDDLPSLAIPLVPPLYECMH